MTFLPGVPFDGQSLGASKTEVRGNFTNYNTVISADHVAPNAPNQGLHNKSSYVAQGSDPAALATTDIFYCKAVTYPNSAGTFNEIFMRRATGDGSAIIQQTTAPGNPIIASNGCTWLPGGLMLQWGTGTATPSGAPIGFAASFPTQCFNVTIGMNTGGPINAHAVASALTGTARSGFTAFSDNGNRGFYYIAIGN